MRSLKGSLIFIACIVAIAQSFTASAKAPKALSMEDRQEQLMSNINQSQLNNELTAKEARNMRSQLADVVHKKAKIKQKKTKLSTEDLQKLDNSLNDISVSINKLKLEKREHPEAQAKAGGKEKATKSRK